MSINEAHRFDTFIPSTVDAARDFLRSIEPKPRPTTFNRRGFGETNPDYDAMKPSALFERCSS